MRSLCLAVAALALLPVSAAGRPGDPDRSFGNGGQVLGRPGWAATVVGPLPGGRVAVHWPTGYMARLVAFDRRGRRDPGFAAMPGTVAAPAGAGAVVLRAVEDPLRAGPQTVTRVGADGRPDPAFGGGGTVAVPLIAGTPWQPQHVLVDGAGRVLLVGYRYDAATRRAAFVVARFTANGILDASYGDAGMVVRPRRRTPDLAVVLRDGSLIAAVRSRPVLIRLDPGGTRVRSFTRAMPLGRGAASIDALAPGGRGRVLVATSDRGARVNRLRRDGRMDPRFRPIRLDVDHVVSALARDRRGRVLLATHVADGYSRHRPTAVRRYGRTSRRQFRTVIRKPRRSWTGVELTSLLADGHGHVLAGGAAYDDFVEGREDFGRSHPLVVRLRG